MILPPTPSKPSSLPSPGLLISPSALSTSNSPASLTPPLAPRLAVCVYNSGAITSIQHSPVSPQKVRFPYCFRMLYPPSQLVLRALLSCRSLGSCASSPRGSNISLTLLTHPSTHWNSMQKALTQRSSTSPSPPCPFSPSLQTT